MTNNGPAPMLLGFFMNATSTRAAKYIRRMDSLRSRNGSAHQAASHEPRATGTSASSSARARAQDRTTTVRSGRQRFGHRLGITVIKSSPRRLRQDQPTPSRRSAAPWADILKEDQAQNTCIFSTEFACVGRATQQYFISEVRNFYSVSIRGYHLAEAGANPISQLAFTLANGFTYVEYYLSRGMDINAFAPNLSFFFSNGMDPEYAVMGRVARRLWAKALKHRYGADERSQMLKYHIQTSGRSLHAQEIDFNDIRTTLQALRIYDNATAAHQRLTRPSPRPPRKACRAIQLIINKEPDCQEREPAAGPSSSKNSPTWWKRPCSPSSIASPNAAACSAPWRPCTSAAASRRKASTTRR